MFGVVPRIGTPGCPHILATEIGFPAIIRSRVHIVRQTDAFRRI
jgi:hypothetical protein